MLNFLFNCCKKRKENKENNNDKIEEETKVLPLIVLNSTIPFISLCYFHIIEV